MNNLKTYRVDLHPLAGFVILAVAIIALPAIILQFIFKYITKFFRKMRGLILLTGLLVTLAAGAQNAKKIVVFDLSGVTGDTTRVISIKGEDNGFAQVLFTSLSCDTARLKIGYSLVDTVVNYPSTVSGLSNPVTLNKLATDPADADDLLFTHTVKGKTTSSFGFYHPSWRPYNMVFTLRDACTSGSIILIHK